MMKASFRRSLSIAAALAMPCVAAWAGQPGSGAAAEPAGGAEIAGARLGQPVAGALRQLAAARPEWSKWIASFAKDAVESCGPTYGSAKPVFDATLATHGEKITAKLHLACDRPKSGPPLLSELWIDVDVGAVDGAVPTAYEIRQALVRRHGDPSFADFRPDGAEPESPRGFHVLWTQPYSGYEADSYRARATTAMSADLNSDAYGHASWLSLHLWIEPAYGGGISPERRAPAKASSGFDSAY